MSAAFAATYPERVSHVIFFGGFARYADLSGSTQTPEERINRRVQNWGQGEFIKGLAPSQAGAILTPLHGSENWNVFPLPLEPTKPSSC